MTTKALALFLESAYARFNLAEFIDPDPLLTVREFSEVRDREIAGLLASALAVGRAPQIVSAVRELIARMGGQPREFIEASGCPEIYRAFSGFRYRFFSGDDIAALLCGVKRLLSGASGLGAVFSSFVKRGDETVLPGLSGFVAELTAASAATFVKNLLPSPEGGSACKRPLLYLRWMIREDSVDPGGWDSRLTPLLVQPMDTHMTWVSARFGFIACAAKPGAPNLRTALEVTRRFREIQPADPVKYDFCLTRPGIRPDLDRNACFDGLEKPTGF